MFRTFCRVKTAQPTGFPNQEVSVARRSALREDRRLLLRLDRIWHPLRADPAFQTIDTNDENRHELHELSRRPERLGQLVQIREIRVPIV